MDEIAAAYSKGSQRLLLLDYDGVLVPIAPSPELAAPTEPTLAVLEKLAHDPRNTCVVISGRPHETLEKWLGALPIAMVAEHGLWQKLHGQEWETTATIATQWKNAIRNIMETYEAQMPGSHIEEKSAGLAFHYRATPGDAEAQAQRLIADLQVPIQQSSLTLIPGKKVVEVMVGGITKGEAAHHWLAQEKWDFVLGAGDDITDETMFKVLPVEAYSIKVGPGSTAARFSILTQADFMALLLNLTSQK